MTLKELQTAVKKSKLNAYIVTRSNMFIGQDLLDGENPLRALTGFSGSAGTLVVTPDKLFRPQIILTSSGFVCRAA